MFSGIVETMTRLVACRRDRKNMIFRFETPEGWILSADQSVAHNGVCLTVDMLNDDGTYCVTAMDETLARTNLGRLKAGDWVNLERSMAMGARLDGHIVQGHVDRTAVCRSTENAEGSTVITLAYVQEPDDLEKGYAVVEKGSVAVNGVSLTAYGVSGGEFKVSIIPYTAAHTNLGRLKAGDVVNIEFDIIGKYIARLLPQAKK